MRDNPKVRLGVTRGQNELIIATESQILTLGNAIFCIYTYMRHKPILHKFDLFSH